MNFFLGSNQMSLISDTVRGVFTMSVPNLYTPQLGFACDEKSISTVTLSEIIPRVLVPLATAKPAPQTMRALRIFKETSLSDHIPDLISLRFVTVPIPTVTPGSVLVKIKAAGLNPSDAGNAAGYFPYTTFPRVPGRDFAGVVVTGPSHLQGQRVFGTSGRDLSFTKDGAHAEYCVVPEDGVVAMPENLSFIQAATIGVPFTTAWLTLDRVRVKATDTVLVIGAFGAVGSAVSQLARAKGCRVITAARQDTADIDLTIDDKLEGVKVLTNGVGPSVVIDTVGDPHLIRRALVILAAKGRLSFITAPKTFDADFAFGMRSFYRQEKEIIGCNSLNYTTKEMGDILREMAPGFAKGGPYQTYNASELMEVELSEQSLEAYRTVKEGKSGKYVICVA
jgi:NADPH2:quinone reductase